MGQITDLIKNYEKIENSELDKRALLVLEMIERVLTYPPLETISVKELSTIDKNVLELTRDLRKKRKYLFSTRLSKIWKTKNHLLQLAKNWHDVKDDFMDEIEYHEEIKWLKDEQARLSKKIKEN
jgi:hypothetical protein